MEGKPRQEHQSRPADRQRAGTRTACAFRKGSWRRQNIFQDYSFSSQASLLGKQRLCPCFNIIYLGQQSWVLGFVFKGLPTLQFSVECLVNSFGTICQVLLSDPAQRYSSVFTTSLCLAYSFLRWSKSDFTQVSYMIQILFASRDDGNHWAI